MSIYLQPEPGKEEMVDALTQVVARVVDHVARLGEMPSCGPAWGPQTAAAVDAIRGEPLPQEPAELGAVLDRFFGDWVNRSFTAAGPGYLAFVPGGGILPAAIADLISNMTNRFTGIRDAAPCLVELEGTALRWLAHIVGMPVSTRGIFTTGGSMAAFAAVVCAREKLLGPDLAGGTVYASSQVHHSVTKAARLAGIPADRVVRLPVDAAYRMNPDALARAIVQDRAAGRRPFLVVSTAGTTNTGAVDPIEEVQAVCRRNDVWHHVDGAYGAFFYLCPELQQRLVGMGDADSLTLDPHKGLFLPYGTGALLVRDGADLRRAFGSRAEYLPEADAEAYDPHQYGPDLSKGFPGLRVWLTLKLLGVRKIREMLEEKRRLAVWAAQEVQRTEGLRMAASPDLSLFAFHADLPGRGLAMENDVTTALLNGVRERGRVMLSGCRVDGRYLARICVLNFRTHEAHMRACIDDLRASLSGTLARVERGGP